MFSEPAQPYTILDEMFFISSITVYQQAVPRGTTTPFLLCGLPAPRKTACWGKSPSPFELHPEDAGCAFQRNASCPYKQKNTPETDAESASGVFYLPALVPVVCLACILGKETAPRSLRPQKLLHFFTGFAVFGVSCFLLLTSAAYSAFKSLTLGSFFRFC